MWWKWSFSPNCWKPLSVQASFQCGVCNKSPVSLLQSYQPQNGKLALTKGSGTAIKIICLPSSPHVASINHCVVFWKKPVAVFIDQPSSQGSWPLIRRPRVSLGRAFGSFSPSENLRSLWRDGGLGGRMGGETEVAGRPCSCPPGDWRPSWGAEISGSSFPILHPALHPVRAVFWSYPKDKT